MGVAMDPEQELEHLRYPIGRFRARAGVSGAERRDLIEEIAWSPASSDVR